jgi:hypothetical protein
MARVLAVAPLKLVEELQAQAHGERDLRVSCRLLLAEEFLAAASGWPRRWSGQIACGHRGWPSYFEFYRWIAW